jgi:hypothetical protein
VASLSSNKHNLSLISVGHDGSAMTVTGMAASEDYIFQYARKIRESGIGVLVAQIQAAGEGYVFSFTIK